MRDVETRPETEEERQRRRAERARQLREQLRQNFNACPFTALIGLEVTEIADAEVRARFAMKPELVGNVSQGILHGGVIASVLDTVGGAMGMVAAWPMIEREERLARMARFGTIDMRVDYLRPGRGDWFEAKATVMRAGKKVCVTRMELHNDQGELIAVGTGTYMY